MKVFTSDQILCHLHAVSDGRHLIVNEPESADIILRMVPDGIDECALVKEYYKKTFVISTGDLPTYAHQGVYTTASGWKPALGSRIRSGAYNLIREKFKNPFIAEASPGIGLQSHKKFLFSFIGRSCHPVRAKLLERGYRRDDVFVRNSSDFDLWTDTPFHGKGERSGKEFFEALVASKFALCPRGVSPNSIRLFECLRLGVAPVVISDGWLRPVGPDWERFCIFVREKEVDQLESIVEAHEGRFLEMGRLAVKAYEEYFCDSAYFNFLVESCDDIMRNRWLPERFRSIAVRVVDRTERAVAQARKSLGLRKRIGAFRSRLG